MSSADPLLAIRTSGSRRLSAAIAGSSEGKTLSVTAINGRAMMSLQVWIALEFGRISAARRHPDPVRDRLQPEIVRTLAHPLPPLKAEKPPDGRNRGAAFRPGSRGCCPPRYSPSALA